MTIHESLRAAREFVSAEGGVISPLSLSEEEINPPLLDDLELRAEAIESTRDYYRVPYSYPQDAAFTDFAFFEDGKQRTVQIGFIPTTIGPHEVIIPVHYFVVAAVILQRDERKLSLWSEAVIEQGILVEKSLVPQQQILEELEREGLTIVDTRADGNDYYDLRRRALREAKTRRLAVENELIERWAVATRGTDQMLVVDGTLMNLRSEDSVERCVGVSKSFGSRYFSISDHNRILRMPVFHRSWLFRFHGEGEDTRLGGRERLSWYLRLRGRDSAEPEFGLVRVEVSPRHLNVASEQADRFSRSLISERLPTSYPRPRWHNHLYPIRECENYLACVMPSMSTIQASMRARSA